ncbi:hypothetical protein [Galbibacter orientalis]|uniref:hypothetical protein n=1 Tax=Galbibacter orientalis TaxID=453852 RepID=UPI003080B5B3
MKKKHMGFGGLILILGLFVLKPLLTNSIKKYRYENEILPIRKGIKERIKREQQSFPGTKGIIYSLSTFPNPEIAYVTGYQEEKNSALPYFDLTVETPLGHRTFSRDTTIGQVIGILINHHDSIPDEDKNRIFNIYYKLGTDLIDKEINRSVSIMRVYLKDSLYDAVFIANTFTKNFNSKSNELARKRLKRIEKELGTIKTQYYQQTIK